MNNPDIQYRGNCQVCGRLHAVVKGNVAKHGYTVKDGWFEGVCNGQFYAPMQHSTEKTAEIVAAIRWDCKALDAKAEALQAGTIHPASIKSRIHGKPDIPWEEADQWQRKAAVETAVWQTKRRAEQGRSIALQLEQLAAERLGTPLVEARRDTAPPPITIGEKRRNDHAIVLEATSVIGPRVYWRGERNGRTFKGWMGSSAWRRLTKV